MATPVLSELLAKNKSRLFVGRSEELALFRSFLSEESWPLLLLHVHGPAGTGKTALLEMYAQLARADGLQVVRLDVSAPSLSPDAVEGALEDAIREAHPGGILTLIKNLSRRWMLIIDDYHRLEPLDQWFREVFLPQVPASCLVVLAGRSPPSPAWRFDLSWSGVRQVIVLENLSLAATREYVTRRGLDPSSAARIHASTEGHPLAVTLACDQALGRPGDRSGLAWDRPMTRLLCEMLLPSCTKEQREVMELSSLLRTTTLEHVEALCDGESSEGYSWLARQECVHYEPNSICLKDLVRAVIETDMIWTNPVRHSALRSKVESVLRRRVLEDASPESLLDWAYLQRESPFLRHVFGSPRIAEVRIGPAQPADHEAIVDFVRKQGTKKAAALAENFLVDTSVGSVVCQLRGKIVGFTQYLAVEPNRSTKRFDCPAVAVAAEVVEASRSAALVMRPTITAKKRGPEAVGVRLALALHVFQRAMHEDVKLSIFSATSPFAWRDSLPQSILLSTPESVFEIDDCRYELVCGDIGQQSAPSLLGLLGGHSLPAEVEETTDLLDDSTAEKAVRQALKDLHDVTRLNANILAKRPHVLERAGREPSPKRRAEAVRKLLEEAFHEIEANPRSRNHALVLRYTYFEPVGTQEETAGELDLPMTTYRRYLRGAVGAMTTIIQRKLANGD